MKAMRFEPAIKWSGSKRPIADAIVAHFPQSIGTYYEPFCGGASVLRSLKELGFSCGCIGRRLKNGWTIEEAIETPNTVKRGWRNHRG